MPVLTAKILSNPTRRSWSQIHDFNPQEEDKYLSHGQLIAVLALDEKSGPEATDGSAATSAELGKELLTRLHEEYFGSSNNSLFERLKNAVAVVGQEFSTTYKVDIVAGVALKNYIFLAVFGGGQVFLKRGGFYRLISGKGSGKTGTSLSGQFEPEDIFLLGTEEFFRVVKDKTLTDVFSQKSSLQEIADNISPLVHRTDTPTAAAVLLLTKEYLEEPGEVISDTSVAPPKKDIRALVQQLVLSLAKKLPSKKLEVKLTSHSRRRNALFVGVVLLLLFAVSIFFGIKQKEKKEERAKYAGRLTTAQTLYQDSLVKQGVDTLQSREKFAQAESLVETLLAEGVKDKQLVKLAENLKEKESEILGIARVKPELFLDLSLVRSGVKATELSLDKGLLVILDTQGERIVKVSVQDKSTKVVGGSDKTPQPESVTGNLGDVFVLTRDGVVELDKQGSAKVVVAKDDEWGGEKKISAFAGNLYLISSPNQIWRYPALGQKGFGAKQSWLSSQTQVDFSGLQDEAVDGSIWVLSGNVVSKFTRGARENFRISDVGNITPAALYTDENLDSVFILDKKGGRVLEFDKKGGYKLQYVSEQIGKAVDFVVSKEAGKIFLLTETQVLEAPLQNSKP